MFYIYLRVTLIISEFIFVLSIIELNIHWVIYFIIEFNYNYNYCYASQITKADSRCIDDSPPSQVLMHWGAF